MSLPEDVLQTYFKGSELCIATRKLSRVLGASVSPITVIRGGRPYLVWAESQGFDLGEAFVSAPANEQGQEFYRELWRVYPSWNSPSSALSELIPDACEQAILFDNSDCMFHLLRAVRSSYDCYCHLKDACANEAYRCVEYLFNCMFRDYNPQSYVDAYRMQGVFASAPTPEMVIFLESQPIIVNHSDWPHIVSRCLLVNNFKMVPWWINERSKTWSDDCMSRAVTQGSLRDMALFLDNGASLVEKNILDALYAFSEEKLDWLIAHRCPSNAVQTSFACGRFCRRSSVFDKLHAIGNIEHNSVTSGAVASDNVFMLRLVYDRFAILPAHIATQAASSDAVDCLKYLKSVKWQKWKNVPEAAVDSIMAFEWALDNLDCDFDSLIQLVRHSWRRRSITDLYPHIKAIGTEAQLREIVEIAFMHPGVCNDIIVQHPDRLDQFRKDIEDLRTVKDMALFADIYKIRFSTRWSETRARAELLKRYYELDLSI